MSQTPNDFSNFLTSPHGGSSIHDDCHRNRPDRHPKPKPPCPPTAQTHVHEIQGSVMLAEEGNDRHNHRFATVSGEVIPLPNGRHKHAFMVNTDFLDHHHEVGGESGPNIDVGHGKHVHFGMGQSTCNDGHFHNFQFASLIESPLVAE